VQAIRAQFRGLQDGCTAAGSNITAWDLVLINALGDLFDIKPAVLPKSSRVDFGKMKPERASAELQRRGHCSALIKVTDDFSELYFGHSSWFAYSNMNRVFKHYKLEFEGTKAPTMSFSSYPGMLSSLDDFYLLQETQLAMTQTTNGIYDNRLYDAVTPSALLAWERVRLANALATSGEEWSRIYALHNSGTYNNQYMVVDIDLFKPGQALAPNTLWVIEQIPGLVVGGDVTHELERGYFPSYNVPYWPEIYEKSGYPRLDERHGRRKGSEYSLAPRASIFRRDHLLAQSLEGLKFVMRENGYRPEDHANTGELDPLAKDPWMAICSRGDLNPSGPALVGCYDSKVTSASLFRESFGAWAVNGPTNQGVPTFSWREAEERVDFHGNVSGSTDRGDAANAADARASSRRNRHFGQPDVFDFEFELFAPAW